MIYYDNRMPAVSPVNVAGVPTGSSPLALTRSGLIRRCRPQKGVLDWVLLAAGGARNAFQLKHEILERIDIGPKSRPPTAWSCTGLSDPRPWR